MKNLQSWPERHLAGSREALNALKHKIASLSMSMQDLILLPTKIEICEVLCLMRYV